MTWMNLLKNIRAETKLPLTVQNGNQVHGQNVPKVSAGWKHHAAHLDIGLKLKMEKHKIIKPLFHQHGMLHHVIIKIKLVPMRQR